MSSISFSGSNSANSNRLYQNIIKMDKLQMYICPKCSRQYELVVRSGVFIGRVPLILNCNHTLCEECIRNTFNKGEVVCADCQQPSKADITNTKLKVQDIFPVNFYLLGMIYYTKPNQSDVSNLSLKPAGVSYRNRAKGVSRNEVLQDVLGVSFSSMDAFQEKCCQSTCTKAATLRCFECNEVYCETCSQMVHKAARGLQTHKITALTSDFAPQLTEKCNTHALPLEFNCNTCSTVLCCYCIVQNHSGHSYQQLSFLNDADRPKFDELVHNAAEKLKRLLDTYQVCPLLYAYVSLYSYFD